MGCSCRSCASRSSCCSASEEATGGLAGIATGLLFLAVAPVVLRFGACACWLDCWPACCASTCAAAQGDAHTHTAHDTRNDEARKPRAKIARLTARADRDIFPPPLSPLRKLAPRNRRGIRIFAEGRWVALTQDFHHPVVEIIHWMHQDRLKTPIILFMSFLNIISQTDANVFMFASQTDLVGTEHFNILHGTFGHAVGPPVQILLFRLQGGNIKRRCRGRQLLDGIDCRLPRGRGNLAGHLPEGGGALARHVRCTIPPGRLRPGVYPRIEINGREIL